MTIDPGDLRNLIRDCAIAQWTQGRSDPGLFVQAFNERYAGQLDPDQVRYGFEQWLIEQGRRMMKIVGKEIRDASGRLQLMLPMELAEYDIPATLPLPGDWVPLYDADERDLDAYLEVLKSNAKSCFRKITDFVTFTEAVRPILRGHPGWKTGDALRWMVDQERGAA